MSLDEMCEIVEYQKRELRKIEEQLDKEITLKEAYEIIEKLTEMHSGLTNEFTKMMEMLKNILIMCKQVDDSQLRNLIASKILAFVER